jgi:hypothetical protein
MHNQVRDLSMKEAITRLCSAPEKCRGLSYFCSDADWINRESLNFLNQTETYQVGNVVIADRGLGSLNIFKGERFLVEGLSGKVTVGNLVLQSLWIRDLRGRKMKQILTFTNFLKDRRSELTLSEKNRVLNFLASSSCPQDMRMSQGFGSFKYSFSTTVQSSQHCETEEIIIFTKSLRTLKRFKNARSWLYTAALCARERIFICEDTRLR